MKNVSSYPYERQPGGRQVFRYLLLSRWLTGLNIRLAEQLNLLYFCTNITYPIV